MLKVLEKVLKEHSLINSASAMSLMELQVIQVTAKLDEPSYGKEGNKSKQKTSGDSVIQYHESCSGNTNYQKKKKL